MSRASVEIVLQQLTAAGLLDCCSRLVTSPQHARFTLSPIGMDRLRNDDRFARGILHGLHADVGEHREDFRSHTGAFGKGSLQIVFDRVTGQAYADVDRWSPYADLVGFVGHAGEVIGGWFRRKRAA